MTTELTEKKLSDINITDFFIDVTYRVIPKRNDNNKLLTISCFDNERKCTYICALIIIKYEDTYTFESVFKYLSNYYKF